MAFFSFITVKDGIIDFLAKKYAGSSSVYSKIC